jgi:hypothetical protein
MPAPAALRPPAELSTTLPKASTQGEISAPLCPTYHAGDSLRIAADTLGQTLSGAGYTDQKWYRLEDASGFAVVTQPEQISNDLTSKLESDRFSSEYVGASGFFGVIKAAFQGHVCRYRMMVFAVSSVPVQEKGEKLPMAAASSELRGAGMAALDLETGRLPYTENHRCYGLVYEYERKSPEEAATLVTGADMARHLRGARLLPHP